VHVITAKALAPNALFQTLRWIVLLASLCLVSGCALLSPISEKPGIRLTSFELVPNKGLSQQIRIGLIISNPNPVDLKPKGMSYEISIAGFDVFSGVTDQVPPLKSYQETPVELAMSANVIEILHLMEAFREMPVQEMTYSLEAKLDFGAWLPAIRVSQTGDLPITH